MVRGLRSELRCFSHNDKLRGGFKLYPLFCPDSETSSFEWRVAALSDVTLHWFPVALVSTLKPESWAGNLPRLHLPLFGKNQSHLWGFGSCNLQSCRVLSGADCVCVCAEHQSITMENSQFQIFQIFSAFLFFVQCWWKVAAGESCSKKCCGKKSSQQKMLGMQCTSRANHILINSLHRWNQGGSKTYSRKNIWLRTTLSSLEQF